MPQRIVPSYIKDGDVQFDMLIDIYYDAKMSEAKAKQNTEIAFAQVVEYLSQNYGYDMNNPGTQKFESDAFALDMVVSQSRSVETEELFKYCKMNGIPFSKIEEAFKVELKAQSKYTKLADEDREVFDQFVTTKNSKPTIKVVKK